MKIFHVEVNGRTNTGEYVDNVTKALGLLVENDVSVFTSNNSCHANPICVFKNYAVSAKVAKIWYYLIGWKRLSSILRKEANECLLHVHWLRLSPMDFFFLKKIKKCKNVRLVFTVHNTLPHETRFFDNFFYSKIYWLFDNLIFHSNQNIIDFEKLFPNIKVSKDIVPHYSYEVDAHIPSKTKKTKLLFFGAIRPYKGLELLVSSLKNISASLSWELIIAGKPEYDISHIRTQIEEDPILKERVKLRVAWIEDDEIPVLFQQSHITVLPYLKIDNSGLVHLAMSYGKTVLVPDIGVFKDLITDKKDGFFFQCNNADSLSEKLSEIIDDVDFKCIGEAAITKMKEHSIENIGASLLNIYNNSIK